MSRSLLAIALVCVSGSLGAPRVHADDQKPTGATVTFPYHQKKLLYSRNGNGGLAYVTSGAAAGASLPVVVFLHGMNSEAVMHMWFGPQGDLRPLADKLVANHDVSSFVLAAPTHTRFATGATVMWHDFDLDTFLDATDAALTNGVKTDRTKVIVVAHSGGGCNAEGGPFAPSTVKPLAVLFADTCVTEKTTQAMADLATRTKVRFTWQATWTRPIDTLEAACPTCKVEELTDLGTIPHGAILPETLKRALPALLPPP